MGHHLPVWPPLPSVCFPKRPPSEPLHPGRVGHKALTLAPGPVRGSGVLLRHEVISGCSRVVQQGPWAARCAAWGGHAWQRCCDALTLQLLLAQAGTRLRVVVTASAFLQEE